MFNSIPVFIAGLSFVAVQGCAVGVPLVAIAVGMGTGAPPPRERNTVLVGDYTLTTTQLYDLNCAAYFEGLNVPDCVSVHFSPVLPDTAQQRLSLAEKAVGAIFGPDTSFVRRADQIRANERGDESWRDDASIVFGYFPASES